MVPDVTCPKDHPALLRKRIAKQQIDAFQRGKNPRGDSELGGGFMLKTWFWSHLGIALVELHWRNCR